MSRYSSASRFDYDHDLVRSISPSLQVDDMKCIFYNNLGAFSPFDESSGSLTRGSRRSNRMRLDEADEDAENDRLRRHKEENKEDQERRELEAILKELSTSNHLVDNTQLENIKTIFVVGGPGSGRVNSFNNKII